MRSYLFKLIMVVSNSTSPSKVSSKIKFANMCQDESLLCNLLLYGIQAWMWWFLSHTKKHLVGEAHKVWVFPQHLFKLLILNHPMFIPCSTV
jgi:hypothetical protein